MISSFTVGSIFEIKDLATPVVVRLAGEMQKLATLTATVRAEMQALSNVRIGSITNRLTAMSAALDRGATAATAMSTSIVSGAAAADASLAAALVTARALTAQLAAAGRAGGAMRVAGIGGGPPPLPGGGGGRGGRHGPFHFGRVGAHVGPVHASVGGSGPAIATGAGIWGVAHVMHEAEQPLHQQNMLRLLGLNDDQISQVVQRARQTASAVPGSGFANNVKTIGELYSVVGLPHALELSQKFATLDRVMALSGKGSEEGSGYILARAGELMGKLNNPDDLSAFEGTLDTMARINLATHGKVSPQEWLAYVKKAGPAAGTLTDSGLYTTGALIQAMGGSIAGTAAESIQRQFAGGVMTKSKAEELTKLGIFKPGDYEVGLGGHLTFKTDAARAFVERAQHDPLSMAEQVLIPALEEHGFTDVDSISRELYRISGTPPTRRELYELVRGHKQIAGERGRAQGALSPDAAIAAAGGDPVQAIAGFTKSFNDLLGALGSPLMQAAVPVLNTLTSAFNALAAAAGQHKTAAATAGGVAAGTAGGAAIGLGIGWLGGPIGAGTGALLGGLIGGGIGFFGSQPSGIRAGMAGGALGGAAAGMPFGPFGMAAGALLGGTMGGYLPSLLPSSLTGGGKQSSAAPVTVQANITVKAETDRPEGLAQQLLGIINKMIAQGHLHNQGDADSVSSSPFVTGLGGLS
jgi:hypothetical protein